VRETHSWMVRRYRSDARIYWGAYSGAHSRAHWRMHWAFYSTTHGECAMISWGRIARVPLKLARQVGNVPHESPANIALKKSRPERRSPYFFAPAFCVAPRQTNASIKIYFRLFLDGLALRIGDAGHATNETCARESRPNSDVAISWPGHETLRKTTLTCRRTASVSANARGKRREKNPPDARVRKTVEARERHRR
jgi:hypothetical protein